MKGRELIELSGEDIVRMLTQQLHAEGLAPRYATSTTITITIEFSGANGPVRAEAEGRPTHARIEIQFGEVS